MTLQWFLNRLRAMDTAEIIWRLRQQVLCHAEKLYFFIHPVSVIDHIFDRRLRHIHLDASRLGLNLKNLDFHTNSEIPLLGNYLYQDYRDRWNSGFQTGNDWPMDFSYDLNYKLRDDIGDARTNWELNRHFQFTILAKNYFATGKTEFLEELSELFYDWNSNARFLWGISWTSVMEVAIRLNSWIYCYAFLSAVPAPPNGLLKHLETGVLNMADYIERHHSRYSSANNHLIVEAYAIGQAGILSGNARWTDKAVQILTEELPRQNYSDGVNKELSLHYQCFFMEAVGLFIRLMRLNKLPVPAQWYSILLKMSRYVSNCLGIYGEKIAFGDDDDGKILDLSGGSYDYYIYILELMGSVLSERYTESCGLSENIRWLFSQTELMECKRKTKFRPDHSVCYKDGGYSILRSPAKDILIGVDHGSLGFGSIAAHGHADALSFQLYVNGIGVFIDPGTFIYHIWEEERNDFRRTFNHNTLCIGGRDQSIMQGPFLWGKKAQCKLLFTEFLPERDVVRASCDGYSPLLHTREFVFHKIRGTLSLLDHISGSEEPPAVVLSFVAGPMFDIIKKEHGAVLCCQNQSVSVNFESESSVKVDIDSVYYSPRYGVKEKTRALRVYSRTHRIQTTITILQNREVQNEEKRENTDYCRESASSL